MQIRIRTSLRRRLGQWRIVLAAVLLMGGAWMCGEAGRTAQTFLLPEPTPVPEASQPATAVPQPGQLIGVMVFPRTGHRVPVYEGISKQVLRQGAGHVEGTAIPGAVAGNFVVAAHRDTYFRQLKDIRPGDEIWVEGLTSPAAYRVSGTRVVSPNEVSVMRPTSDSRLTLVTCYPFVWIGPAPRRYIVTAEYISARAR